MAEAIEINDKLKGIRILLVEDNEFNVMVAKEELEDTIEQSSIMVAYNGKETVDLIRNSDFDIIQMDIQMPVLNGFEVTIAIRELPGAKSTLPIIAMTANVMKEEVERCREVGMDEYISKPFDTKKLIAKIVSLVSRS